MKALKKWMAGSFCRPDGSISTAKVGSWLATTGGSIVALPAAAAQAGIPITLPGWLSTVGFVMGFIGLKMASDGIRNAVGKK